MIAPTPPRYLWDVVGNLLQLLPLESALVQVQVFSLNILLSIQPNIAIWYTYINISQCKSKTCMCEPSCFHVWKLLFNLAIYINPCYTYPDIHISHFEDHLFTHILKQMYCEGVLVTKSTVTWITALCTVADSFVPTPRRRLSPAPHADHTAASKSGPSHLPFLDWGT